MSETIEHSESSSLSDGWRLLTVNEIKSDKDYSCVGGPFGSNLTTADYVGSAGVPVIRGTNLSGSNVRFKDDGFVYVSEKKADSLRQNMAFPNDLIFTQRGTLGQVGHIPDNARFARYVVSQSQMKLTVSTKVASIDYIYHYFSSPNVLRLIENSVEATGVPHITLGILRSLPVPLPPLPQQRKIARALTTVDNLIEKTEALIEKYKSIKQGMMHDLFTRGVDSTGRLRLPYEDAPHLYKQSPLGWIPKEWEVGPLGAIADLQVGYAFKSRWFREDRGLPLLRGENVGYGRADWKDTQRLDESLAFQYAEYELQDGDIVIGMDRTFTKSGVKLTVLQAEDCPALLVQRVGKFIATRCESDYLRVLLANPTFHADLMLQQKGMDIPHLSKSEILTPAVPRPSSQEQQAIADRLLAMDRRIASEGDIVAKLKLQKSGLMQDLLTGKVRVNVDDAEEVTADV